MTTGEPKLLSRAAIPGFIAALLIVGSLLQAQDLADSPRVLQQKDGASPVDVQRLADQSSVIVRGRLAKRNTRAVNGVLYTIYDLTVVESVKGRPGKSLSVAVLGGAAGNVQLETAEAPPLINGAELIFFGKPFAGERGVFKAVGEFAGLVPVLSTAEKRSVVVQGGKPEPVESFLERLRELNRPGPERQ